MHQEGPPPPLVNHHHIQKRANAADQFRNEHIPPESKSEKFCPEKVNQQYHPMLAEELAKRRSVKNPRIQL